jgi:translation elongation factor EF-G
MYKRAGFISCPFSYLLFKYNSPKFYGKETDKTNSRMEQEFLMRIANEINRQIRCGVTMSVQMSWGVSKRIATLYEDRATLALRVSGVLHNGWVYVSLDEGRDCYIITLLSPDKKKVVSVRDEVYCEELGSVIDNLVERKEEWTDEQYEKLAMADSEQKMKI